MKAPPFFIGSLPFQTSEEAIAFVKRVSSHLPFLPQLPEANPQEDMIGQVLRGFELGHWDERASSCLELFQNEFGDSPRFKIQIAGPFTVARSMSAPFEQVSKQWLAFWQGLRTQLRQGAFRGELWLQIDEPFWNKKNSLPEGYTRFLEAIRTSRAGLRLGMHSCATERPFIEKDILGLNDFFSFDFEKTPFSKEEQRFWEVPLGSEKTTLVVGKQTPADPHPEIPLFSDFPKNVWLSATCGLAGWTMEEISKVYGDMAT